ncbi:MAG TPA: lysophospholipid acyltransferase family protein [Gemmatimonadaceae bacterium]|nr:lysophospholipid acyltransferase family protein [Gemmatimonadaceae bacterium]
MTIRAGEGAPRRNRPVLRTFGRTALALVRWRIVGRVPDQPKFVAIVAPHTSNWDFPLGVLVMFALDLKVHWFGKDTLFRTPLGPLFRLLGGRPVNRAVPEGVVDEMAAVVRAEPRFILALAPEGTRKRVARWRTGFYHLAERADIPILPVSFDWAKREVTLGTLMRPTGDIAADFALLQGKFRREMARHPAAFWDEAS